MKKIIAILISVFAIYTSSAQVSLLKDFNGTSSSTFGFGNAPLGVIQNRAIIQYRNAGRTIIASLQTNGVTELLDSVAFSTDYSYTTLALPTLVNGKLVIILGRNEHHVIMTDGTKSGTEIINFTDAFNGYMLNGTDLYVSGYDKLTKIDLLAKSASSVNFTLSLGNFSGLAKINSVECLFVAQDNADYTYKVYKYDLATKAIAMVKSLGSTVSSIVPGSAAAVGSKIVFLANEASADYLYVSDGTLAGTIKKTSFEDTDYFNYNSIVFNNKYFFSARTKGVTTTNWKTLWCTDGTTVTELQAANDNTYLINPSSYTPFNGKLYYVLSGGGIPKLCYTDGTVAGTVKVNLPYDIGQLSVSGSLATDANKIYFGGWVINSGKDGVFSYSKTGVLENYYWGSAVSEFQNFSIVNGRIIFQGYTSANGFEYFIAGSPDPTGINEEISSSDKILVSPNPATDKVQIKSLNRIHHIELLNQVGEIKSTLYTPEFSIANFTRGLYMLRIFTEDGKVSAQKLVLE